jgi:hypothetical protein
VRRTTTHDSLRPEGMSGPVTLIAQGRDLYTAADGTATVRGARRRDRDLTRERPAVHSD